MNPMTLMKLAGLGKKFRSTHPKIVSFFQKQIATGIPDDPETGGRACDREHAGHGV